MASRPELSKDELITNPPEESNQYQSHYAQQYPRQPYFNQQYPGQPYHMRPYPGQPYPSQQQYRGSSYRNQYEGQQRPQYVIMYTTPPPRGGYPPDKPSEVFLYGKEEEEVSKFVTVAIRHAFVRKVFSILLMSLLFTCVWISIALFVKEVRRVLLQHFYTLYIALILALGISLAISCSQTVRRKYPLNMILFCVYVILLSWSVGIICSFYQIPVVLLAFGATTLTCFFVTVLALQTKFDITKYGGLILIGMIVVLLFIIVGPLLAFYIPYWQIIIASICVLLFSLLLMYDIQSMVGGKSVEYNPEDYIVAAISLYTTIIIMFIYMLTLARFFGER